ncbi:ATV_HP_G0120510.mRNA.1.CDS.1 [Saccharomyces cerevisiae]|nr:ATV_HP_G0120510.mRNA.1.CDS.1 [Saccharomyces cerevisiae]CAI6777430.1 ATV_HP_G0120510.mRNA.1.CDS.1 [Saccharomyces cerevisiae]
MLVISVVEDLPTIMVDQRLSTTSLRLQPIQMVGAHLKPRRRVVEKMMKKKQKPRPATIAQETLKVKPNNKNISSNRPADTRDIVADKPILGFNAFAALESEDEDDEA